MLCRKCTKDMPEGALYCPWCGAPIKPVRAAHKRGNGLGTAIKRGKTWTARVVIAYKLSDGDPPHKQPVYRTKGGFRTKRDALEYCATLKSRDFKPKGNAPQLLTYWEVYSSGKLESLGKSKQIAYRAAWKKIQGKLQYRPVDQITVAELCNVVSASANTYYTAKDCKTVLTRLFELAGADGWCSKDLPSYISLPQLEEKERQPFGDTEQAALWKLYEDGDMRAAIPLLMICTGMMPGEIQNLKVENIDLEQRKIFNAGIKTKIRRKSAIYLPDDILPVMEDLIANAKPNGYLWSRNEKKFYENYYAALKAANCRRLEPYSCRHTTATRLAIDKQIAPQTIQRMMRWSSTKMLDRYAHPDDADVFQAANTFNRAAMAPGNSSDASESTPLPNGEPPEAQS